MKKLLFAAIALTAVLTACGKDKKDEQYKYQYTVNGCDTGEHKADSKDKYCSMLKDDGLNNGCAADSRAQEVKSQGC